MGPESNPESDQQFSPFEEKHRHGCVTTWLILLIIGNSIFSSVCLFANEQLAKYLPGNISPSFFYLLAAIYAANIIFAMQLLQWKRWGFYGFIGTAVAGFMINLSLGSGIGSSLSSMIAIGVLFAILQIKKNDISAWEQME